MRCENDQCQHDIGLDGHCCDMCPCSDLRAALFAQRAKYEKAQADFDQNWVPAFVRLRHAVRDAIYRIAKIPSNPGWTDEDVLDGLKRAVEYATRRSG